MSVYFGRLFELLTKMGITQEALCKACNISPKTILGMKRGVLPSLEVIDKICNYLNCDFNDIMEHVKSDGYEPLIDKQLEANLTDLCGVYRVALKEYMQNNGLAVGDISKLSGLSINTIKSLLVGKIVSSKSCTILYSISKDFSLLVDEKILLYKNGVQLEDSAVIMARNKIEKFAGNADTIALLNQAVFEYRMEKFLDGKSFAEQIDVNVATLHKLMAGKAVTYTVIRKILDVLSDETIIKIAGKIDETKPISTLSNRFRPRNCNKCPAFDKERKECKLLYKVSQKDNGEYYSAETCSKPRSYTAVYEEGQARNIPFKKPENVVYIPAKFGRWDEQ